MEAVQSVSTNRSHSGFFIFHLTDGLFPNTQGSARVGFLTQNALHDNIHTVADPVRF